MTTSQLRARYLRIVFFFARVTLGFIFWEIIMSRIGFTGLVRRTRTERNRSVAVRFRALAISMGGLMIKVGQFLSARLDVLPPEITAELADLQDEVPAEQFEFIRRQVEEELGGTIAQRYAWFDVEPLAAASLGQAHRARLNEADAEELGFQDIVVKVQRPSIEKVIEVDLSAIRRVGGWLKRYKPVSDRADVMALIEEFANTTREEIDYLAEASNAEEFAENFDENPDVYVPRIVWEYTTRRVLTLEDVSAIKLRDYDAITAAGIDRTEVAAFLADTYLQQIFEDGFFHADPHPGNIFITPRASTQSGRDWQLTFIDFGMMGHVPSNLRMGLRELVIAVGLQDGVRLVKSFNTLGVLLPTADKKLIEMASVQVFERFGGLSMDELRDISHDEMMNFGLQFQELLLNLPFQLPEDLLLMVRSLAILSGMCTGLDPQFSIWAAVTPYATSLISEEGDSSMFSTVLGTGAELLKTMVALPGRADRVLTLIERGEMSVKTPLLDLRVRGLERTTRRMTTSVIFASLLIGGAILYGSNDQAGTIMMWASAVPLLLVIFGGRGRHSGR